MDISRVAPILPLVSNTRTLNYDADMGQYLSVVSQEG